VVFRVNGYAQGDFIGQLRRIDAAANATTRQVEVVVDFKDKEAVPRVAGLFAEGRIETGSSQALLLPESAVVRAGDAAWVWRAGAGVLNKVAVKLGERDPRTGRLPILQGLSSGDRVLRSPGSTLADGQKFELGRPAAAPALAASSAAAVAASAAK
jgi:membrane fusion protein, multidrug efflux system